MIAETSSTSIAVPIVAAAAVGGFLYARRRGANSGSDIPLSLASTVAPLSPPPGRWVWPLPRWQGRAPVVSDGFGSSRPNEKRGRKHRGVDIMYRRRSLTELTELFPPRAPHSLWHFLPPGTLVLAAADGTVWSAGETPRGWSVVLSHGAPWASYYTHMITLLITPTARGASGQRVRAGQPIGIVGADPKDKNGIAHLHFELWHGGNGNASIDPKPLLDRFEVIDPPKPS